jgi:hypothetical protein
VLVLELVSVEVDVEVLSMPSKYPSIDVEKLPAQAECRLSLLVLVLVACVLGLRLIRFILLLST